jgi:hypothetical protein
MTEQRRLAAIVSADVAGYSRLMGRDESGTLAALKVLRQEVVDPGAFWGRLGPEEDHELLRIDFGFSCPTRLGQRYCGHADGVSKSAKLRELSRSGRSAMGWWR